MDSTAWPSWAEKLFRCVSIGGRHSTVKKNIEKVSNGLQFRGWKAAGAVRCELFLSSRLEPRTSGQLGIAEDLANELMLLFLKYMMPNM